MNNPELAQVFTSDVVANYMVSLLSIRRSGRILDPCIGGGAFLRALQKAAFSNVIGIEIDDYWYNKAVDEYKEYTILSGDFLKTSPKTKFDGIIMNPPYIRHEKIDELRSLGITKETIRSQQLFRELPKTANMYMYFVIKGISLLKENGEMVVIFPSSWMTARGGKSFKRLIEEKACILDQIDVYGEVFEDNALVEVSILRIIRTEKRKVTKHQRIRVHEGILEKDIGRNEEQVISFPISFMDYGTVRRGFTTGANSIFINPSAAADISDYLRPIISSPKDFEGFNTDHARLDKLLYIPESEQLSDALKEYLSLCEKMINETGEPKALKERIDHNLVWYKKPLFPCDGILFSYIVRNDMRFPLNTTRAIVRDNFYIIHPQSGLSVFLLVAFLNNYYSFYQLEMAGKKYGAGLLKIQKYDIEELRFPDISLLSNEQQQELIRTGKQLVITNDASYIEKITSLISEYWGLEFEQIKKAYLTVKKNRLERV